MKINKSRSPVFDTYILYHLKFNWQNSISNDEVNKDHINFWAPPGAYY